MEYNDFTSCNSFDTKKLQGTNLMKVSLFFLCLMGLVLADGCSTMHGQNMSDSEKGTKIGTKKWGISHECILTLEHLEGFRSTPYVSPNGVKTIGYGHEIKAHEHIAYMSRDDAERMIYKDIRGVEAFINQQEWHWMDQGKYDALLLFIYNIGIGRFKRSCVYGFLQEGRLEEAMQHWRRYDRYKDPRTGKEVVSQGLKHRRMHEVSMFKGEDQPCR